MRGFFFADLGGGYGLATAQGRAVCEDGNLSGTSDDRARSLPCLALPCPSAVDHSVLLAVDETGVEAATAAGGASTNSAERIEELILNRSFLFLVYDRRSGLVLFYARMMNPV